MKTASKFASDPCHSHCQRPSSLWEHRLTSRQPSNKHFTAWKSVPKRAETMENRTTRGHFRDLENKNFPKLPPLPNPAIKIDQAHIYQRDLCKVMRKRPGERPKMGKTWLANDRHRQSVQATHNDSDQRVSSVRRSLGKTGGRN